MKELLFKCTHNPAQIQTIKLKKLVNVNVNRKYLMLSISLITILVIGFIIVKGNNQSDPNDFENLDKGNTTLGPVFKLEDLNGVEYSLADYKVRPVIIHFMSVGCGGQYSKLNDIQLKQLKNICNVLCDEQKVTIFTVLVSTCTSTDLSLLYDMYNITWILGNDYQDNKLDVIEKYSKYEPQDGMVLILGEDLIVKEIIKEGISYDTFIEKIYELEG